MPPSSEKISPSYPSIENPLFCSRRQLLQVWFRPGLRIDAHNRLRARRSIADPGSISEHQFQSVLADNFAHPASGKFNWISRQLSSELLSHLRRQAKVFTLRVKGTNFVK